jgi:hypothetical protein
MFHRDTVDESVSSDRVYEQEVVDDRAGTRTSWGVAQVLGLIAGIYFTVLGIAALSSTGFDTDHIYTPHNLVWHFPHSPLFALIEIAFGVLLILAAVIDATSFIAFLGAISLAFGIVIVADASPDRLNHWLAVTHRNGWLYLIVGAVLLVAALVSPWLTPAARYRRARTVQRTA